MIRIGYVSNIRSLQGILAAAVNRSIKGKLRYTAINSLLERDAGSTKPFPARILTCFHRYSQMPRTSILTFHELGIIIDSEISIICCWGVKAAFPRHSIGSPVDISIDQISSCAEISQRCL